MMDVKIVVMILVHEEIGCLSPNQLVKEIAKIM
jgi:hypothetical protein